MPFPTVFRAGAICRHWINVRVLAINLPCYPPCRGCASLSLVGPAASQEGGQSAQQSTGLPVPHARSLVASSPALGLAIAWAAGRLRGLGAIMQIRQKCLPLPQRLC